MENALTSGDIALLENRRGDDMCGGGLFWIFALLLLFMGGGYGNFGGFGNRGGGFNDYATAASQQEILFGQHFQNIDNKIDRIGNGIADATFALNNSIVDQGQRVGAAVNAEGRGLQMQMAECCCTTNRNIDSVRFDMANYANAIQSNDAQNTQKILDAIAQNKIDALQQKVTALELQNAMCGVVRYPSAATYNAGYPFVSGGCGCGNI